MLRCGSENWSKSRVASVGGDVQETCPPNRACKTIMCVQCEDLKHACPDSSFSLIFGTFSFHSILLSYIVLKPLIETHPHFLILENFTTHLNLIMTLLFLF